MFSKSAEVPRVSLDLSSSVNNECVVLCGVMAPLLQLAPLLSCVEPMKMEGSLHWHGDAAGNKVSRDKNRPLISHCTELRVKQYFPISCIPQALAILFCPESAAFPWLIILYNTKQQQNKKQQKTVDNYIKYAAFKLTIFFSKDPNQNKQLLTELLLKPCL